MKRLALTVCLAVALVPISGEARVGGLLKKNRAKIELALDFVNIIRGVTGKGPVLPRAYLSENEKRMILDQVARDYRETRDAKKQSYWLIMQHCADAFHIVQTENPSIVSLEGSFFSMNYQTGNRAADKLSYALDEARIFMIMFRDGEKHGYAYDGNIMDQTRLRTLAYKAILREMHQDGSDVASVVEGTYQETLDACGSVLRR